MIAGDALEELLEEEAVQEESLCSFWSPWTPRGG